MTRSRLAPLRRTAPIAALALALASCAGDGPVADAGADARVPPTRSAAPPIARPPAARPPGRRPLTSAEVIAAHNSRVAGLTRLWSNASTEIFYRDDDGERRWEQGEGPLQFLAPSRLALTVGKSGQRVLFLGCDADRFWLFELADAERVSVGRHANVGAECAEALGIAVNPLDLIDLIGLTPLPESAGVGAARSGDSSGVMLSRPTRSGLLCYTFDAFTAEPVRVDVLSTDSAAPLSPILTAELVRYETITLRGAGGIGPRVPTRVLLHHLASQTEIRLHLADPTNGKPGQLSDDVFDFDALVDAFGPGAIRVLDRECPEPAVTPSWLVEHAFAPDPPTAAPMIDPR